MTWIIIIVVAALIIGPVMYVLPSAKDKRLMALRAAAREAGLEVKLSYIAKLDAAADERVTSGGVAKLPSLPCVAYRLAHQIPALQNIAEHQLLRIPVAPTLRYSEVFSQWGSIKTEQIGWWQQAGDFWTLWLKNLPDEVIAVQIDGRYLACYWRESGQVEDGVIEAISTQLRNCHLHFSS